MAELRWLDDAEEAAWGDLAGLFTLCCREAIPTERQASPDEWRAAARDAPDHRRSYHVMALERSVAVGAAAMTVDDARPQQAWLMFLYVLPTHRRQGIASALLEGLRHVATKEDRVRISGSAVVGLEPGRRFAEHAGGRPGLVVDQNRCLTARLDPGLLEAWRERAAERAGAYSLVAFDGVCPEEHLDAFVAAIPIMNTAPRAWSTEDIAPPREHVRARMEATVAQGTEIWTVCARHDPSGDFVGYTELFLSPYTPWKAAQGDTGVHPSHRERGIGRWLKAHNAFRLLAERPKVEFIETWNASTNLAMGSINRDMGFEVVARRQEWVLPVATDAPRPREP